MRNTKIFIAILFGIIVLLSWIKFSASREVATQTPEATASPQPSVVAEEPWQVFATDFFTLNYPPEASAAGTPGTPDMLSWRVNYMGQVQKDSGRTQTELFDGYILTIDRFEVVGEDAAKNQATSDRLSTVNACSEESATEILAGQFQTYPSYSFVSDCLGTAKQTYFQVDDYLYRISEMIASTTDLDQVKYQYIVNRMVKSFVLLTPKDPAF